MRKNVSNVIMVLVGNLILAFDVAAFILPYGFVMGGATGVGLALEHYLSWDLSIVISLVNVVLWILGLVLLGKKFAMNTFVSSLSYPFFLSIIQRIEFLSHLTDDYLMAAIFAGALLGLGIAIIMRAGASTGGLDVIPLALNKYFHFPVAPIMYLCDFVALMLQISFSDTEQILYGILLLLLSSLTLNYMLLNGKRRVQLMIISNEYKRIKEKLMLMDMGATLLDMETAYTGKKQQAVLVITDNRRMYQVMDMVQEIDDKAFITVSSTNEVHGRGFTLDRYVD